MDKYRFTANDGTGDVALIPVNTGLRKRWERQGDGVSYRLSLETELLFRRKVDAASYDYFKDRLDAGEVCETDILIEHFCAGEWSEFFSGRIVITEGKYDLDKCEAQFKVFPNDIYECARKSFSEQTNWLNYGTAKTLNALYGTIETEVCNFEGATFIPNVQLLFLRDCWSGGTEDVQFDPTPDPAEAWRPVAHVQVFSGVGLSEVDIQTTWKRETVTQPSQPPGSGWISLGSDVWVRPVSFTSTTQAFTETTATFEAEFIDEDFEVSNGHLLADMIEGAVDASGCGIDEVVSNFFGINPDDTNPTNDAYDWAKDVEGVYQSVLMYQKSDIVNEDATNDATYLPLSLNDVIADCLSKWGEVYWAIVTVGSDIVLRIEHISYFEGSAGIDLTTLDGGKHIRGLNRFEVEGEIPAHERLAYQESFNEDFLPQLIRYDCANGSEIDKQQSQMCADFAGLLNNDTAGLQGFVTVSAYLISGSSYLLDNYGGILNGAFAWKEVINRLWVFNRYSMAATSTAGGTFTVQTVRKRKAQAPIQIPFCCEAFEPSETVETALGLGSVKTAEHDTEAGILTLNLLHE